MRYVPDQQSATIVLLGKFNPAIFSPAWLAKVGIITWVETQEAKVQVIHPEITQFGVERLRMEVQKERFAITTTSEPFVRILDDVVGIFGKCLPHTPADKLGINYEVHFQLDSSERRMALGRALAPLAPWTQFGKRLEGGDAAEKASGMMTLTMQETGPSDRKRGWRRVQIEPSPRPSALQTVRMHINDHFEVPGAKDEEGAKEVIDILKERFDGSMQEAKAIVTQLMDYADKLP